MDAVKSWKNLSQEEDPHVVSGLLWDWLDHLKEPLLHPQDLPHMLENIHEPINGLALLDKVNASPVS